MTIPFEPLYNRCFFTSCRGKGDYYRLGHGSDDHVRRPKRVAALQNKKVIAIATGSLHCVACTDTGEVYTWGDNDEGQLGDGSTNAIQRPRLVTALQVGILYEFNFHSNHNCNKILKSDWLSTVLISAHIGQSNRTIRVKPK